MYRRRVAVERRRVRVVAAERRRVRVATTSTAERRRRPFLGVDSNQLNLLSVPFFLRAWPAGAREFHRVTLGI